MYVEALHQKRSKKLLLRVLWSVAGSDNLANSFAQGSMVFDLVCFKILYVKPFWYFHSKFKARKTLLFLEVSADVHDQNI